VCSHELEKRDQPDESGWVLLGFVRDKMSADYAKEVLTSYDIPAVVISKSGFFGQAGLTLTGFYKGDSQLFEVSVPRDMVEEAVGIMDMVLGDQWLRKE
jgi:hypothetical protein